MERPRITIKNQKLSLENVINARELGGLIVSPGKRIKRGLLLRGGSLAEASDSDLKKLQDQYHVVQVFDMRTEREVSLSPDRDIVGARHNWLPTLDPTKGEINNDMWASGTFQGLEDFLTEHASIPRIQEAARRLYSDMVTNEYTQLQYAAFIQQVIYGPPGATYWHCSQGKDRTGFGAAFILAALGADRNLIMEEYGLSNICYEEDVRRASQRVIENGGGEAELKVIRTFIGVNVEYFSEAFDLMDRMCGSTEGYLREMLLLGDNDFEAIRNRYLEDV